MTRPAGTYGQTVMGRAGEASHHIYGLRVTSCLNMLSGCLNNDDDVAAFKGFKYVNLDAGVWQVNLHALGNHL